MAASTKHLEDLYKQIMNYLGLTKFDMTMYQLAPTSPEKKFRVVLSYDHSVDYFETDESKIIKSIVTPLVEAIENSDNLKELTKKFERKIQELETEVVSLREQVEKLKPFEQHYSLELQLRHGREE